MTCARQFFGAEAIEKRTHDDLIASVHRAVSPPNRVMTKLPILTEMIRYANLFACGGHQGESLLPITRGQFF
jgi:hypothetical protein